MRKTYQITEYGSFVRDKEVLRSTSTSIAVTVEEGKLNTYYARFQK